jgi:predicted transcriptional regulator
MSRDVDVGERDKLAAAIRQRREKLGISVAGLMRDQGIADTTTNGIEYGDRDPKFSTVARLARALGGKLLIRWGP